MIIGTKDAVTILHHSSFKQSQISSTSFNAIMKNILVDPTTFEPVASIYLITDRDLGTGLRSEKNKQKFLHQVASKHKDSKILFICRGEKNPFGDTVPEGINAILVKPSTEQLENKINSLVSELIDEHIIGEQKFDKELPPVNIPEQEPEVEEEEIYEEVKEPEPEEVQEVIDSIEMPEPEQPVTKTDFDSILADRIRETDNVHNISMLLREMSADAVIKEVLNTNANYKALEARISDINNMIVSIYADDKNYPTLREKAEKTSTIFAELVTYSGKANTALAEHVTKIFDTIFDAIIKNSDKELNDAKEAMRLWSANKLGLSSNARVSALTDEQARLYVSLENTKQDLNNLAMQSDTFVSSLIATIATKSAAITEKVQSDISEELNIGIVSEQTSEALDALLELKVKAPQVYGEVANKVSGMIATIDKILKIDRDIIDAKNRAAEYMTKHKLEDTVTADSIVKKTLRVYVGAEGSGLTSMCHAISSFKARQNYDTLLLDLTGNSHLQNYGLQVESYDKMRVDFITKPYLVAAGTIENDQTSLEQLIELIHQYARHYRCINIMVRPEQKHILNALIGEALSMTYIVNPDRSNMTLMSEYVHKSLGVPEVVNRLLINKMSTTLVSVLGFMGLSTEERMQVMQVPFIPAIQSASIDGYDFTSLASVRELMNGVLEYV